MTTTFTPEHRGIYNGIHKDKSTAAWATKQGYILKFVHSATGHSVAFPANISAFEDSHMGKRKLTRIHEDSDQIRKTQNVFRSITFTFSVVNGSLDEARYNEQNLNLLMCMMYPKWSKLNVKTPSTIRVRGLNFLKSSRPDSSHGVELWISSLTYDLSPEPGFVTSGNTGVLGEDEIYPVQIDITIKGDVKVDKWFDDDDQPWPEDFPAYR